MPDYSVLKGFDAGLLKDGKLKWAAAGRDPSRLVTVLRHAGVETSPRNATWGEAKSHWREQYWKFIDGTYLREFAPFVDVVSEANEYWADSTWSDSDGGRGVAVSMRAAAAIWNDEFRGRSVTNPHDGGHGTISADCRVALGAVTVSFGFPRDLLAVVVDGDNIADMHCYMQCVNGQRVPNDWQNCSGLFDVQEQAYGLKPRWLFGESGPFIDTDGGWRRADCLGGDVEKLVSNMRAWWNDLAGTAAYREGRLMGAGCWFTSGNIGWKWYQLETAQLTLLADALRPMWKPAPFAKQLPKDDDMDIVKIRADIKVASDARARAVIEMMTVNEALGRITAELNSPNPSEWWETAPLPFVAVASALPLTTFKLPGGPVYDVRPGATYDLVVTERVKMNGEGWLRVSAIPLWCKATDLKLK